MTQLKERPKVSAKGQPDSGQVQDLKESVLRQLRLTLARSKDVASKQEVWTAVCLAVRETIMERYMQTQKAHLQSDTRRIHYLSLEYLMGRLLNSNLCNLGIREPLEQALQELGFELPELCEEEHDMGLGNGGLGRLAACFLDSMAPWTCLLLDMEFITSMVYSNRNLRRAGRLKSPTIGGVLVIPGKLPVLSFCRR